MLFEIILTLAMTFAGEVNYDSPERLKESQYIYQVAKNRANICNTDIQTELLKHNMFSAQNDSNCKKNSKTKCLRIDKYNISSYADRLEDVFNILTQSGNNINITFYHSEHITLKDTGQDESVMIFKEKVGNHLFYSSSDINFCKAKSIIRKKKYINQKNNPLENYRKKIKKRIYDKRIQNQ